MWLRKLRIENFKSIAGPGDMEFSKGINVLIGENNAGKSTILRAIHLFQPFSSNGNGYQHAYLAKNKRGGNLNPNITIELAAPDSKTLPLIEEKWDLRNWTPKMEIRHSSAETIMCMYNPGGGTTIKNFNPSAFNQREPNNFIYPYFSRRKPQDLNSGISQDRAQSIEESFNYLPSKIDRLNDRENDSHEPFRKACKDILGLTFSNIHVGEGKPAGLRLPDETLIQIDSMGEGTINVLSLLVHLCPATKKLFLIEELGKRYSPKSTKRAA